MLLEIAQSAEQTTPRPRPWAGSGRWLLSAAVAPGSNRARYAGAAFTKDGCPDGSHSSSGCPAVMWVHQPGPQGHAPWCPLWTSRQPTREWPPGCGGLRSEQGSGPPGPAQCPTPPPAALGAQPPPVRLWLRLGWVHCDPRPGGLHGRAVGHRAGPRLPVRPPGWAGACMRARVRVSGEDVELGWGLGPVSGSTDPGQQCARLRPCSGGSDRRRLGPLAQKRGRGAAYLQVAARGGRSPRASEQLKALYLSGRRQVSG